MSFRAARPLFAAVKPAAGKAGEKAGNNFVVNWLSDSATYPVIGVMAVAIGLVGFQGQRLIRGHPDITFDKDDRHSFTRDNDNSAEEHHEHALRNHGRKGQTQIFPGLNSVMVSSKVGKN